MAPSAAISRTRQVPRPQSPLAPGRQPASHQGVLERRKVPLDGGPGHGGVSGDFRDVDDWPVRRSRDTSLANSWPERVPTPAADGQRRTIAYRLREPSIVISPSEFFIVLNKCTNVHKGLGAIPP